MKAILVDAQNNVRSIELNPTDRIDVVDLFAPCNGCGDAVFRELITGEDFLCTKCRYLSRNMIEDKDWRWEHPGYWTKVLGSKIQVVAGDSEYRFDFTFAGEEHDCAYGPDMSISVQEWPDTRKELFHRGCFTPEEMEELEMVYEDLYASLMSKGKKRSQGVWEVYYGEIFCPDSVRFTREDIETEHLDISKQMIYGVDKGELTQEEHDQVAELAAIMLYWLAKNIK